MTVLFPSPEPLLSLSRSLVDQSRQRSDELWSEIIRTIYNTQFAQTAPELAEFRNAIAGPIDEMDEHILVDKFQKTVPLTTYDSYAPLILRFFEKPCKESTIVNLLAPGVPDYIIASTDFSSHSISGPLRKCTGTEVIHLWHEPMHNEDENSGSVKTVYMTAASALAFRQEWNLHPEDDRDRLGTLLDHVVPYATALIPKWRTVLLIHVLFAIGQRSLESITVAYASTFVDMMRYLDAEFDMIVDCITNGTIPYWDELEEFRQYLQINIHPDLERAEELRGLGRPSARQGWCGHAWPNMSSITMISSGSFATYTPLVRWFLGPNIDMLSLVYGASEALIGLAYNPTESNQYKLSSASVVEFPDASKGDSIIALAQSWEVERGRRYELILTTQDGLWRYRLGDMVEIVGFDPTDGVPVIQFVERRNVAMRFHHCTLTEELRAAILSIDPIAPAQIAGWTTTIDHRHSPPTVGFFVELSGGQVLDLTHATGHVLNKLTQLNKKLASAVQIDSFRRPTIRLVSPGTFTEFLQLNLEQSGSNLNFTQQKVPVVLPKAEHATWFLDRVIQEL